MDFLSHSDISPHARERVQGTRVLARAFLVVLLGLVLEGCQSAGLNYDPSTACATAPGDAVTMPEEGLIVLRRAGPNCSAEPPLAIHQAERPEIFAEYVALAGGLAVGETKTLLEVEAYVLMNEDGSIIFAHFGIGPEIPPHIEAIQPGCARYDEIIARVGGLSPGERKMLLRQPSPQE